MGQDRDLPTVLLKVLRDNRNAHMREHIVEWANMGDHEPDTNWSLLLCAVADHFDIHADGEPKPHPIQAGLDLLSDVDLGAIAGLAGHGMHACGSTALEFLEISENAGFPIPGFIIARFIHGGQMRPAEQEVILRLLQGLDEKDRQALVCVAQASLHTLGFTADDVRAMRTQPVAYAE